MMPSVRSAKPANTVVFCKITRTPKVPAITEMIRIYFHEDNPNFLESRAVWILSRLSSKINIPNAAKREDSLNLEPMHKTAIPSTIKKMPQAKSYWNARQYKSFEKYPIILIIPYATRMAPAKVLLCNCINSGLKIHKNPMM